MFKKVIWKTVAQSGELKFHKDCKFRATDGFMIANAKMFSEWNILPNHYAGMTVLDMGCGSKLRSLYFDKSKVIAMDPLANQFMDEIEWCDLKLADEVYSVPAEYYVKELQNKIDLIMCINVLDHCYDTEKILENMLNYIKPTGSILISVDVEHGLHHLHPNPIGKGKLLDWYGYGHNKTAKILDDNCKPYGMGKKFTIIGNPLAVNG